MVLLNYLTFVFITFSVLNFTIVFYVETPKHAETLKTDEKRSFFARSGAALEENSLPPLAPRTRNWGFGSRRLGPPSEHLGGGGPHPTTDPLGGGGAP